MKSYLTLAEPLPIETQMRPVVHPCLPTPTSENPQVTYSMIDFDQENLAESLESNVRSFDPTRCVFCNHLQHDLRQNIMHIQRHHSFIIPNKDYLAVSFETLHSVIVREAQCICCGSVQGSFHAAKQHVLHKGYCRIDVFKGSAFRESCNFVLESEFSEDTDDRNGAKYNVITSDDHAKLLEGKKFLRPNARGHCHMCYALFRKGQR